jgi:predicted RNA-binding Zn-ribbon protein involved in translation (DUF1610 family)
MVFGRKTTAKADAAPFEDDPPLEPPVEVEPQPIPVQHVHGTPLTPGQVLVLLAEGAEPEEGWRRFPCPRCGVKHDVMADGQQTPGTWVIEFACANCDYTHPQYPVTGGPQ